MTLGEKIKKIRKTKRLTQAELAAGKITRNMLSLIESDKASPSLETLYVIADGLGVSAAFLISEDDDDFFYEKKLSIKEIKKLYSQKKYQNCIDKIKQFKGSDDETEYILASSYYELGKSNVLIGSLKKAEAFLTLAKKHLQNTVYDTSKIKSGLLIYTALCNNIQSPLLELDCTAFEAMLGDEFEFDFYKYLLGDREHKQKNSVFEKHLKAKALIKERKYYEALDLLHSIEEEKTPENYNAYVIFSVYNDMENCYKQLTDFENAYRYASKRLSIIEGFKL